jgi:hypothetical protein
MFVTLFVRVCQQVTHLCLRATLTLSLPTDVANKQHLGSASKSPFCDLTWLKWLACLTWWPFFDLGCLYCKQTQRAFIVLKNTQNWLNIYSVDQRLFKIQLTRVWNFSQGDGTPGTERDIAFSKLAVKVLNKYKVFRQVRPVGQVWPKRSMFLCQCLCVWIPFHSNFINRVFLRQSFELGATPGRNNFERNREDDFEKNSGDLGTKVSIPVLTLKVTTRCFWKLKKKFFTVVFTLDVSLSDYIW